MQPINISDHPLVQIKIGLMRDRDTPAIQFAQLAKEVSQLLFYEATRDLPLGPKAIHTPICGTTVQTLAGKSPILVPVLRAGLGMCFGVRELLPQAKIGTIGLARDEETLQPQEYYEKLPKDCTGRRVFLLDPMLATGNSACKAIEILRERGCQEITFLCLVAAQQGLEHLQRDYPDVPIFAAAYDGQPLNENGYIVPGLGDAGDRIFGTD